MAESDETETATSGGRPVVLGAVAVVALLAGLGVGTVVVGPRVKGGDRTADSVVAPPPGAPPRIVRIDNVIVTPTSTAGTRYVIMSVAFEVPDEATEQRLHRAEVPLRDAIIGILESESLATLSRPGAREALKTTLGTLAARYAPGARITVYIPQFLVQ